MPKKLNQKEFIKRIKLVHPNYDFKDFIYTKNHNKGKVICPIHGIFESRTSDLLRGRGCPTCGGSKRITTLEFIEKVKLIHPNYDFKEFIYLNNHTKGKVICPIHGIFEAKPHNLLYKKGCPKCNKGVRYSLHEFIEMVKMIHPNYDFKDFEYINWKTKGKVMCPIHGIFKSSPNVLLRGSGCPKCGKVHHYTTNEFIEKISLVNKKYNFSKFIYVDNRTRGIVICPIHGEFLVSPNNLCHGSGCPICKESKGEKFIAKWLLDNDFEFTPQKKFPTCKNKRELPFDFHINNTNILIEYDGEQHFKAKSHWGGEENFKNIIYRDNIKNNWAKENNYTIIRLNYTMSSSEKIKILKSLIHSS